MARLIGLGALERVPQRLVLYPIYRRYRHATMIPSDTFVDNLEVVREFRGVEGAVVECGTWKGGMAAAMIEVAGSDREYHFFDSFEGLPPAQQIDGEAALKWQSDTTSDFYFDNCTASLEGFRDTISMTGARNVHIHAGFFEETMTGLEIPPIAILRLDADWYESTMICLETLFDRVVAGGVILVDDYYTWDGCSRAVHDFLSQRKLSERIRQKGAALAVIVKH